MTDTPDTPGAATSGTDAPPAAATDTGADSRSRGLDPGSRFRCEQCGNVTRFDVVARERTRRYWHFDLGGDRVVDEEEVLERVVESVTCRWCGGQDAVIVEVAPTGDAAPTASAPDPADRAR